MSDSTVSSLHVHQFGNVNQPAEKNTRLAVIFTAVMMVVEIICGYQFASMALLADGWHMSTHVFALGLSVAAYMAARKLKNDVRFTFGAWKIEVLGGYTSALFLLGVAALMVTQSVERMISPVPIDYIHAMIVAVIGLIVNLICAWLLNRGGADHHGHHHEHPHEHHDDDAQHEAREHKPHAHGDLNLRAAYLHVLADAMTSVLAIIALLGGMTIGAAWLDPVMGIVGAVLITVWSFGLIRDTARVLLDAEMNAPIVAAIRKTLTQEKGIKMTDLHVWRVGSEHHACILSVEVAGDAASSLRTPDDFKALLSCHKTLAHVTVEVNPKSAKPLA
jgi:cation diffusion facilitator family transporter